MELNAIKISFFTARILLSQQVTKSQFNLLAALKLSENPIGISRNGLRRFLETNGQSSEYRNYIKVLEPLIIKGWIIENKKKLHLSASGYMLLCQIERKINKLAINDY